MPLKLYRVRPWHHVGRSVLPREHRVGGFLLLAGELLGLGIEREDRADLQLDTGGIQAVVLEVGHGPLERVLGVVGGLRFLDGVPGISSGNFGPQPVRDIPQVAQGARQVPFQDVRVQVHDDSCR